jgi:hypothetical protein
MVNLKEIFSYNKAVYLTVYLTASMLAGNVETPLWVGALVVGTTLLTSFIFGILVHSVGKTTGIATWRFLTYSTRTRNGKILSVISNTLLWVAVVTKGVIIAQDKYWLQIMESGMVTNSQISILINGLGIAVVTLIAVQTIFSLYMVIRKIRLTFFNKKKVSVNP